jgi:hypothetical protein
VRLPAWLSSCLGGKGDCMDVLHRQKGRACILIWCRRGSRPYLSCIGLNHFDGDLCTGPLLLPGFPGILEVS